VVSGEPNLWIWSKTCRQKMNKICQTYTVWRFFYKNHSMDHVSRDHKMTLILKKLFSPLVSGLIEGLMTSIGTLWIKTEMTRAWHSSTQLHMVLEFTTCRRTYLQSYGTCCIKQSNTELVIRKPKYCQHLRWYNSLLGDPCLNRTKELTIKYQKGNAVRVFLIMAENEPFKSRPGPPPNGGMF
jgi:hypothetical protein